MSSPHTMMLSSRLLFRSARASPAISRGAALGGANIPSHHGRGHGRAAAPEARHARDAVARPPLSSARRSSSAAAADHRPLRRRRRRGGGGGAAADGSESARSAALPDDASTTNTGAGEAFAPRDPETGELLDAESYLELASLSPWVPCPDVVIKRVFEIAEAGSKDVHADLGCGDGRLNFAAVGGPFAVRKSWGVDVDDNILDRCRERLGRRFVPARGAGVGGLGGSEDGDSEAGRLEFLRADLKRVIERRKDLHQRRLHAAIDGCSSVEISQQMSNDVLPHEDWSEEDDITRRLEESTVVTMYFVDAALEQIKPYLECTLGGREDVRVITVGYEMRGWDATWVERVLGLTIFKYDMRNVTSDPVDWKLGGDDDEGGASAEAADGTVDLDYAGVDESPELAEFLRRKREKDLEELDGGLRIHHDEALNDFAQSRSMSLSREAEGGRHGRSGAATISDDLNEWETIEGGWDFDEDEDPMEIMRNTERELAEARVAGRGKGMKAGLDVLNEKKAKDGTSSSRSRPVWKKP